MLLRAVVCSAALLVAALPARGADLAMKPWKYQNPFCDVRAQVSPATDGSGYGVSLFTGRGSTIDAHVTLVGTSDAYDADVTEAPLEGPLGDRQSEGVLAKVPAGAQIAWFYVDSYAIDGGKPVGCPSYVFDIDGHTVSVPQGARTIETSHLEAVPSLKCGHPYIEPGLRGDLESPVGRYGGRPLTVLARSYIDSNGYSIREELVRSSGVSGLDDYMLGAMHVHQFAPAQFLCTPVVSTIEVELKYFP